MRCKACGHPRSRLNPSIGYGRTVTRLESLGLLAGLPDEGKGQVFSDMAARVTRGLNWPCGAWWRQGRPWGNGAERRRRRRPAMAPAPKQEDGHVGVLAILAALAALNFTMQGFDYIYILQECQGGQGGQLPLTTPPALGRINRRPAPHPDRRSQRRLNSFWNKHGITFCRGCSA